MPDKPVVKVGFFGGKPAMMPEPKLILKATPPKPKPPKPVYVPPPPRPKRLWDNYVVLYEVQKTDKVKYVIAAAIRDGVRYINIREFYYKEANGEWRPSKDGIVIPLMIPIHRGTKLIKPYGNLMIALKNAAKTVSELPLYDEANVVYKIKKEKNNDENQ